jgi:hypothetical protein
MSCRFSRFFRSIYRFSTKISRFPTKTARKWPSADLSVKPADLSVFPVFTVPPSSPVRFGRILPIFAEFYRNFQKPSESVTSGFRSPAEFSNTGYDRVANIFDRKALFSSQNVLVCTTELLLLHTSSWEKITFQPRVWWKQDQAGNALYVNLFILHTTNIFMVSFISRASSKLQYEECPQLIKNNWKVNLSDHNAFWIKKLTILCFCWSK